MHTIYTEINGPENPTQTRRCRRRMPNYLLYPASQYLGDSKAVYFSVAAIWIWHLHFVRIRVWLVATVFIFIGRHRHRAETFRIWATWVDRKKSLGIRSSSIGLNRWQKDWCEWFSVVVSTINLFRLFWSIYTNVQSAIRQPLLNK